MISAMVKRWTECKQVETRHGHDGHNVMPAWSIWVGAGVVMVIAATAMTVLFALFGAGTTKDKTALEIVKIAGSVVVGTGGGVALLLAARRQRSTELSLLQTERDLKSKESAAADARHDANERRATELYAAAAEQLGSDKAPVRLAGLYALERFGQANPEYRQTVINVLCAYLRMPFAYPYSQDDQSDERQPVENRTAQEPILLDLAPALASAVGLSADGVDPQDQERQVRLTAQRIIAEHLRGEVNAEKFWPDLHLDFAGAVLIDLNLEGCFVSSVDFKDAVFRGPTYLQGAHFLGSTSFRGARFAGHVWLRHAHFHSDSSFWEAQFDQGASFDWSRFYGRAKFFGARFLKQVTFEGVKFESEAWFNSAEFGAESCFKGAQFQDTADFRIGLLKSRAAVFRGNSDFRLAYFLGAAEFDEATFETLAIFDGSRFYSLEGLEDVVFMMGGSFSDVRWRTDVARSDVGCPDGWTAVARGAGQIEGMEGVWGYFRRTPPGLAKEE